MLGKAFSISASLNYTSDTISLALVSTILASFSTTSAFFGGGLIIALAGIIGALFSKERSIKRFKKEAFDEKVN